MLKNNRIFIVTHIEPKFTPNNNYHFLKVGDGNFEAEFNDRGLNSISDRNSLYSELTGLYWIWKNYKCNQKDIVGIVHYRRALSSFNWIDILYKKPLSFKDIQNDLQSVDIIIPLQEHFALGIYKQYEKKHFIEDLNLCLEYLKSTNYLSNESIDTLLSRKYATMCNMMICRKEILDRYCEWLFPILFKVEKEISFEGRSGYQTRALGFLSERLFNIWLWTNPDIEYLERPVVNLHKSGLSNLNRYLRKTLKKKKYS